VNARSIVCLVGKDVWLMRWPIAGYVLAGLVAIALTAAGGHARAAGLTLAMNVLIGSSFHVMLGPVLGERERRTLAFTMTLPVTPQDVAVAKVAAAFALFLVPAVLATTTFVWLAPVDVFALTRASAHPLHAIVAGWLAYYAYVIGAWCALYVVVLATAVVSESVGWTVATLGAMIFFVGNFLLQVAPNLAFMGRYVRALRSGTGAVAATIGVEAAFIAAVVALMMAAQARKTSFV
jgi:ABC-2 type transport system permease protein